LTLIVDHRLGASAEAAAEVRKALLAVRPDFVVTPPTELRAMIEKPVATSKFGAWVLGMFAGLALLLAGVGLMTSIGWWVAQRTREVGVRIALGATRLHIVSHVARQGLTLAALGIAAGCGIAALVTQYMASWIYGVAPVDPVTFAASAGLMLAVAAAALFVPTRRASRVDPVIALRAE
jgi:ABC-type antimicrobial peptide transport system permease subunit